MRKLALTASAALVLAACTDDHARQQQLQAQQYAQQQQYNQQMQAQQYAQQQYAQPPVMQPQVVQPQVIQAPAAPVVVQQQHDNTLTNMALGAVIGHTIANMGNNDSHSTERVVEHKTVIIDNRSNPPAAPVQPLAPSQPVAPAVASAVPTPVAPAAPVAAKTSAMDMNKLSASANQTFNTGSSVPTPVSKPSGMDMSKLSSSSSSVSVPVSKPSGMDMSRLSSRPSVSLAKPSSSMNMSKLGKR